MSKATKKTAQTNHPGEQSGVEAELDSWRKIRSFLISDGLTAVGLAVGLILPAARASFIHMTGGIGGDFIFELGLIGIMAGLWKAPSLADIRSETLKRFVVPLLVIMSTAGFLSDSVYLTSVMSIMVSVATLSLLVIFYFLGRMISFYSAQMPEKRYRGIPRLLLAVSVGAALSSGLLPVVGPYIIFLLFLVLFMRAADLRLNHKGALYLPALLVLAGLAFFDSTVGLGMFPHTTAGDHKIVYRKWHIDGPDEIINTGRKRFKTTVAGDRIQWMIKKELNSRRKKSRKEASAAVASKLFSEGSMLVLGPRAESYLHGDSSSDQGSRMAVTGERRIAEIFRRNVSMIDGNEQNAGENISSAGIRSYLRGKKDHFAMIYYADPFSRASLAAGSVGRSPCYHMTVEALGMYIDALEEGGFLIMETSYSLKVVSILKEIERCNNFPLTDRLMVYGGKGRSNDIIILCKGPFDKDNLNVISQWAGKRELRNYYRPGVNRKTNSVSRLVYTEHPRGYYAAETDEFSHATDDRPFFYQVQKLLPRTRRLDRIGLSPRQRWRILGLFPLSDLPWFLFSAIGMAAWLVIFAGRCIIKGNPRSDKKEWRHRFFLFYGLFGTAVALYTRGGLMTLMRDSMTGFQKLHFGLSLSSAGLAAGLLLAGWPEKKLKAPLSGRLKLMLPAMCLPLAAGLLPPGTLSHHLETVMVFLAMAPALVVGGMVLSSSLIMNRNNGNRFMSADLAVIGLGAVIGNELAVPVSQTFGISFGIILAWVVLFVSIRIIWRVPSDSLSAPDRNGA